MTKKLFFTAGLMISGMLFSQSNYWKQVSNVDGKKPLYERNYQPTSYKLYQLNVDSMKEALANAPQRFSGNESLVLKFPTTEGKFVDYVVQEASVMDPVLQAKYSDIRSYVGYEKGNASNSIRFSISPYDGLNIMYFNEGATSYLDTYSKDNSSYILYGRDAIGEDTGGFICHYENPQGEVTSSVAAPQSLVQDGKFRNYRLAISTTVEYSDFHIDRAGASGGTVAERKAVVLAAINASMTRVNGVYEKTISLTMTLIPNNDLLISIDTDAYGPGFSNESGSSLLGENQTFITATIGSANYDIGHIFSTGGGGVATLNSPCNTNTKARGVTGSPSPINDAFNIDYVAHEMGHQWGATHTFDNSCSGNRTASTSVEPGSGSTIMAYAGICPPNIKARSDAYFHVVSVNQMYVNITQGVGSSCGANTSNNNQVPVIQALTNYSIPYGTAFTLSANATDPDGDALTYLWEQTDTRTTTTSTAPSATQTSGAVFRSQLPTTSNERTFPVLTSVVANNLTPTWEVIPNVARNLTFSVFVNDNKATGNQAARANMTLAVANTGPFKVTSHTAWASYVGGEPTTITWDVAGTNAAPINTQNVKILLSTDNGLTFQTVLAESVPNTGTASVVLPNEDYPNCRIMVKAVNNVYFALNSSRISVAKNLAVSEASKKTFALYPNPAKEEVNIHISAKGNSEYQVFDMSGRLVKSGKLTSNENKVSLSGMKAGTYRVVINTNGNSASENLIVK